MMKALSLCAAVVVAFAPLQPAFADSGGGGASDGPEVYFQVKTDPKDVDHEKPPEIEATIIHAPNTTLDKFVIYEPSSKVPVQLKATSMHNYVEGNETVAVAIVMLGWEMWIGNDQVKEDDPGKLQLLEQSRAPGVLNDLEKALDEVKFGESGPPGSVGELLTYADRVKTNIPMGALSAVTGGALGTQQDYYGTKGRELVQGVRQALSDLHGAKAARKALIVVGDGCDTNPDAAKSALAELKKQAVQDHIQVFAIVYKSAAASPDDVLVIDKLAPPAVVNGAQTIVAAIKGILARLADRVYVTFPGYDTKLGQGLTWDGQQHELVIKIDKDDTDAVALVMSPKWAPPKHGGFPWWLLIVIPIGGLVLIGIGIKVFGKKEQPMPMPMQMAPAPMEAPKPAGPMKTVMIGAGGDQDGFPIVGWLVPLNGQNAYQTYRLRPGLTKIGTTQPSDIVVNDGFMSTEHCQITCSPAGFTLLDNGSTNGSYVNDKKIQKHDLVDNDVVTLGKTNFKFKSIN